MTHLKDFYPHGFLVLAVPSNTHELFQSIYYIHFFSKIVSKRENDSKNPEIMQFEGQLKASIKIFSCWVPDSTSMFTNIF